MPSPEEVRKPSIPGLRVMVAEDEWLLALEIQALLGEFGCAVIGPASNLNDAQRLAEEMSFDIGLLDARFQRNDTSNLIAKTLEVKTDSLRLCDLPIAKTIFGYGTCPKHSLCKSQSLRVSLQPQ
jgi:hypothetical protein